MDTGSFSHKNDLRPIGVFDSGIGGLTVLKEIWKQLPNENTVYFGDSGRMPYGTKSHETIKDYSMQIARFLETKQVKMIVIACSSACSHGYEAVRNSASVPVIEVISSGARMAVSQTRNGNIGVVATRATVESNIYKKAIEEQKGLLIKEQLNVEQVACPLFVMLAEEGWWSNEIAFATASRYLQPLLEKKIDTLVLGCTHYPLLAGTIQQVMGKETTLINAGESVAKLIRNNLKENQMEASKDNTPFRLFYTSDDPDMFENQAIPFLGGDCPKGTVKISIEDF